LRQVTSAIAARNRFPILLANWTAPMIPLLLFVEPLIDIKGSYIDSHWRSFCSHAFSIIAFCIV